MALSFWTTVSVLVITKTLKEEAWALKYAFSIFVKLYGFRLSIAYIARPCHPYIVMLEIIPRRGVNVGLLLSLIVNKKIRHIVLSKRPLELAAQAPKFGGGRLHGGGA